MRSSSTRSDAISSISSMGRWPGPTTSGSCRGPRCARLPIVADATKRLGVRLPMIDVVGLSRSLEAECGENLKRG